MKTLIIRLLFVLAAMLPGAAEISAQIYEADYLIGNYIRAFTTDEEGTRWRVKIPNGTKIEVSHRIAEDDSTSCRSILAEFEYEGEIYTTEARWLKFSDDNPKGTIDIFASDDFSPTDKFVRDQLAFTHFKPLSAKGRFLYGLTLPVLMWVLMIIAVIMILRSTIAKSAIFFIPAVLLQIYSLLMLGDDTFWWCLPEYQGTKGALAGFIPLVIFFVAEFMYIICLWTFAGIKIWPAFLSFFLIYPLVTFSYMILGSAWIGLVLALAFPLLINTAAKGTKTIPATLLMILGVIGFVIALSMTLISGGKIVGSIITGCPFIAMLLSLAVKSRIGFHTFGVRKIGNSWQDSAGNAYSSESAAKEGERSIRRNLNRR